MKQVLAPRATAGFSLIEMLVAITIVGLLLMLVAPSFSGMMDRQRLRGTNDQLVTDLQLMRTEAVSRQEVAGISFGSNASMTCYVVHTCGGVAAADCGCDCTQATPETRCLYPRREVKLVRLLRSDKVEVQSIAVGSATSTAERVTIEPSTGALYAYFPVVLSGPTPSAMPEFWTQTSLTSSAAAEGSLQIRLGALGRPSVCAPGGLVSGPPACP